MNWPMVLLFFLKFITSTITQRKKSNTKTQQVLTEPAAEKSLYSPVFESGKIDKRHLFH